MRYLARIEMAWKHYIRREVDLMTSNYESTYKNGLAVGGSQPNETKLVVLCR